MPDPSPDLTRHYAALLGRAEAEVPAWLRAKVSPEDIVQQAFAEAARTPEKFVGRAEHEVLAYLLQVIRRDAVDAVRKHERERADVSPAVLAESSWRIDEWLKASQTSPSEQAARREQSARLAAALAALPDAQRVAVEMHFLRGLPGAEIARLLDRSREAVYLLIHRAVAALRGVLTDPNA
jgi:RNA polymerase sigma-70 factor (ECF subfamily)